MDVATGALEQRKADGYSTIGRLRPALMPALSITGFLLIWYLEAAVLKLIPTTFLPPPTDVLSALYRMMGEPVAGQTLWGHAQVSLLRFALGFTVAAAIAIPLGILMAWYESIDAVVNPIFEVLRFIPPIAWVPFAILWYGTGIQGQAFVIGVGVFAACLINAHRGVKLVDPVLVNAARVLGAKDRHLLWEVALPSAFPVIVAGIRIGAGLGWMSLIGAELVAAEAGLGYLIEAGQNVLALGQVIAGMIVIGFIGTVIDIVLRIIERRVGHWRE